ncbi:hypothetical protein ASE85_09080 [Sphingobium sp. Leaf26]|nr:hypothetical protein ASE85_09080 [Sphingobium sp. Leaf26]
MSGPLLNCKQAQHELSTVSIKFFLADLSALIIGGISSPWQGALTRELAVFRTSFVLAKFFLGLLNLYYFD